MLVVAIGIAFGADPMLTTPSWDTEGLTGQGASRGRSVASCDVNGDGFTDVVVGAPLYPSGSSVDYGVVLVYHGSPTGLSPDFPDWYLIGSHHFDQYGRDVACAGDVNGDGYGDVIFSVTHFGDSPKEAFLVHGSPSGLDPLPSWSFTATTVTSFLNLALASAGDVNGDSYDDVIIGDADFASDRGKVFLFLGSANGLGSTPAWEYVGGQAGAYFGASIGGGGDVNNDGYDDVIVGAFYHDNGETNEGAAYVFHGSVSGPSDEPAWIAEGNQEGARFGTAVATDCDVDADEHDDVFVGAPGFSTGGPFQSQGRTFLYRGSPAGLPAIPSWTVDGEQSQELMGRTLSCAGDVNGDSYADLLVGATDYSNPESGEGRVLVFMGSSTGLAPTAGWQTEGNQESAGYASSLSTAGDVNGDGFDDVIVGAPSYSEGVTSGMGEAFVYHGGPPCDETTDSDGDGYACSEDNCPVTHNPDQLDPDADGLGAACDNCPATYNPSQTDQDDDGWGTACDCPDNNEDFNPGVEEVNDGVDNQCDGLVDETSSESFFADPDAYGWPAQAGATGYQAARADTPDFTVGCMVRQLGGTTSLPDTEVPAPGEVFFYLNRALTPNPGSWGADSSGQERSVSCAEG